MFTGILIEKDEAGYRAAIKEIDEAQLPEGDVTVRVSHSTLNYKDGLAITGRGPVVRKFPLVPGIDLVGTVVQSDNPDYRVADRVVLNGWGVGWQASIDRHSPQVDNIKVCATHLGLGISPDVFKILARKLA